MDAGREYEVLLDVTDDPQAAATLVLAQAVADVANQIRKLGNGNALTEMGAIEGLGKVFMDGFESLSGELNQIATSIRATG
jgi:hypothetical protein